jgi:hypothetical protein
MRMRSRDAPPIRLQTGSPAHLPRMTNDAIWIALHAASSSGEPRLIVKSSNMT